MPDHFAEKAEKDPVGEDFLPLHGQQHQVRLHLGPRGDRLLDQLDVDVRVVGEVEQLIR